MLGHCLVKHTDIGGGHHFCHSAAPPFPSCSDPCPGCCCGPWTPQQAHTSGSGDGTRHTSSLVSAVGVTFLGKDPDLLRFTVRSQTMRVRLHIAVSERPGQRDLVQDDRMPAGCSGFCHFLCFSQPFICHLSHQPHAGFPGSPVTQVPDPVSRNPLGIYGLVSFIFEAEKFFCFLLSFYFFFVSVTSCISILLISSAPAVSPQNKTK